MADLRRQYRDRIVDILDRVLAEQAAALDSAVAAVAGALAGDRLVYVAGSGHSHLIAEEVFYRAGGIAAAQAILDPDLMLHLGAERSTLLEREEGRAAKVLLGYPVGPGDVVFVASNSGRNAYPIEMALAAHERGATTVALTSLRHAGSSTSRHSSGKLLYEVADIVIDNGGEYGDAMLPISGRDGAHGPLLHHRRGLHPQRDPGRGGRRPRPARRRHRRLPERQHAGRRSRHRGPHRTLAPAYSGTVGSVPRRGWPRQRPFDPLGFSLARRDGPGS